MLKDRMDKIILTAKSISFTLLKNNRFYSVLPVWMKKFLDIILVLEDIIYIKMNLNRMKVLDDILKIAFTQGLLLTTKQIKEEIKEFLLILDKVKPKVVLEIGTARGGTLLLFSNIAHEEAILISVDLYQTIEKRILFRYIGKEKQKIYLIQGDSHSIETLRKIGGILRDNKVDFLFIGNIFNSLPRGDYRKKDKRGRPITGFLPINNT